MRVWGATRWLRCSCVLSTHAGDCSPGSLCVPFASHTCLMPSHRHPVEDIGRTATASVAGVAASNERQMKKSYIVSPMARSGLGVRRMPQTVSDRA